MSVKDRAHEWTAVALVSGWALACIIHEDSPVSGNSAKQVARSREKRGPLAFCEGAELDLARCEEIFSSDGE